MRFAEKLRRLIDDSGRSQSEVAEAIGLQQSRVSRWARGDGEPKRAQLVRLARALGVTVDFLADDTLDEPPKGLSAEEAELLRLGRRLGVQRAIDRVIKADDDEAPGRRRPQVGDDRSPQAIHNEPPASAAHRRRG